MEETGIATDNKINRRNQEIRAPRMRVIDSEGQQVGIMPRDEALALAVEAGLDLVEIQPNVDPPVCRIMDFGKFRFEQQKRSHAARKKTRQVEIKEVKLRPTTDSGDYNIKLRNLRRFLADGDKVKVTIRFRGREMAHQELGEAMVKRIAEDIAEEAVVEQYPRMEGRLMVMMVAPKRKN